MHRPRFARRSLVSTLPLIAGVLAASVIGGSPSRAGSTAIQVTTSEDELNVDGDCSLREAVIAANTNLPVDACPAGSPGDDLIHLQPYATYTLAIPGRDEDLGATGDLDITERLHVGLEVPGQTATIDAAGLDRIFDVADGVPGVDFKFLTLRNGNAGAGEGGAVRIGRSCIVPGDRSNSSLVALVVQNNHAAIGGGIHIGDCNNPFFQGNSIIGNTADTTGGGVSVIGTTLLLVENSTFSGNSAGMAGGAIWAQLDGGALITIFATIVRNVAPDGAGIWGFDVEEASQPLINATIVAENQGPDCGGEAFSSDGGISDDDTCLSLARVASVRIEPLSQVGHDFVHLLAADSPAIDSDADPQCAANVRYDQLVNERPQDGDGDGLAWCDAGSIEAAAVPFVPPNATPGPTPASLPDTAITPGASS